MLMRLQSLWYRLGCVFLRHDNTPWRDALDGDAIRMCTRCLRVERQPFMKVWRQVKQANEP